MTVTEIAKLAGVSKACVSRYFNHGYVSEEKRKKIKERSSFIYDYYYIE